MQCSIHRIGATIAIKMELDSTVILSIAVILGAIYRWITGNRDYFHGKPIPSMAVRPFLGSTGPLLLKQCTFPEFIQSSYSKFSGARVYGLYDANMPMFVICDPELIKRIAVKDFDHFMDHRPIFGASESDHPNLLFEKSLIALAGQKWRNMRSTLSPAFTGSKMRQMFELVMECSESMVQFYHSEAPGKEYEMKDVFSRFANDVIATCAFGIKVDSLRKRNNEFFVHGSKMLQLSRLSVVARILGYRFAPTLMGRLGIDINDQEQNSYFSALVKDTVRTRKAEGIVRLDMIHLLMQAKQGTLNQSDESDRCENVAGKEGSMTEQEMIAQCVLFFLAGFDTVSTILTFLAYELASNLDVQTKLYEEIKQTHESLLGQPLSYDTVQKMPYMDMVVSEVLRKWPAIAAVDRLCVQDYELIDITGLTYTIDRGSGIWIPIFAIHHDPKYYPDPERFIPERFSGECKDRIDMGTYLPFGIGPRNCIGSRFALMEVKAVVYHMLRDFSFQKTGRTQDPPKIVKGFAPMKPESGVYLEFRARK